MLPPKVGEERWSSTYGARLLAVAEVLAVFCLLRIILVYLLLPQLGLGTQAGRFLVYIAFIVVSLLLVVLHRSSFEEYGLGLRDVAAQARIALSLFVPFAIMGLLEGLLLPWLLPAEGWVRWLRVTATSAAWVVLLLWCGRVLNSRPQPHDRPQAAGTPKPGGAALSALVLLPLAGVFAPLTLGQRLGGFAFYLFFLGPGEEILYRGYMQSRLNAVFGRPFRLLGANWGWGLVIATLLFGFMHAFNSYNPALGRYALDWPWAVGSTVAGLVFAYLRERTGSVVAPAILHGLPQAIAALFMTFG